MTNTTLTIRVESDEEFFDRALSGGCDADAGEMGEDQYSVSLPNEAALARVLTEKILELIRTIAREEPGSQRELARLVDRDIKNISNALTDLTELGVIKFKDDGRSKRLTVWYDDLHVEYDFRTSNNEEVRGVS
ncbi:winged helix DNA-binding protein [Halopelagius fulvigenes]|uniref:Winged helix DNA-binding protein n=1 Tax=Halopelagius fulvigenes TaxID=1198324 RepID=A0ABD5TY56_9EURY